MYLIDTNVFLQGKNFHYQFGFCTGFWDWVVNAHASQKVFSINKVRRELLDGPAGDPCVTWANAMPAAFFLPDDTDPGVMTSYAAVQQWAASSSHYQPRAKAVFANADKADAFLIATAMHKGWKIATHEKWNAEKKNGIPIPNAASAMGVQTLTIYELLTLHSAPTFNFVP